MPNRTCRLPCPSAPRGIATLAVVVVLLVAASLIVFFANRGAVFEQRTSANHLRAAQALAAAESGLEWTIARLNDPRRAGAQCTPDGADRRSFRERYAPIGPVGPSGPMAPSSPSVQSVQSAPTTPSNGAAPTVRAGGLTPLVGARPGCRLGAAGPVCACPQAAQAPDLSGDDATFTVELAAVAGDPDALRITSRGCSSAARDCVPGGGAAPADAVAVVQSLVKLVPPWVATPVAAVTAGGAVDVATGVQLINTDAATQGLLVHAAGAVAGAGIAASERLLITVPGSPLDAALLAGDGTLAPAAAAPAAVDDRAADAFATNGGASASANAAAANPSAAETFFARRFGQPLARFRDDPAVRVISGCSAADCALQVAAAGAEGHAAFYVDGDLQLDLVASAGAIGSEARPVLLVVGGNVRAVGAAPWFGLVHTLGDAAVEGIDLRGALVAGGNLRLAGSAAVGYAPAVLEQLRARLGSFARVPGSWRDGRCASEDPAQPCSFNP